MFGILLIVYIIFCAAAVIGGYFLKNTAAKDEAMKLGLRISAAQKSMDTWEYANSTLGQSWFKTGIIALVLGVPLALLMYKLMSETAAKIAVAVLLAVIVCVLSSSITAAMRGLMTRFDENGRPVEKE